jgi:DNA-binding NtrC family response regulator
VYGERVEIFGVGGDRYMGQILLIQDPGNSIGSCFGGSWFAVDRANWATFDRRTLCAWGGDLIIAAALTNTENVIDLLRWITANPINPRTLAILPESSSPETMEQVSKGADDFAIWPVRDVELLERVKRVIGWDFASEARSEEERSAAALELADLVGKSVPFLKTLRAIPSLAGSNRTVLITGETGTGKELCARAIHRLGSRRNSPFIPVDCAAFPDHLFENEMFGHTRGAYTDAHRDQKGLVALAENGTIFLDEIDSLSPTSQGKLLRFLQDRTYRPLGAESFVRSNANVLVATNRDLERLTQDGKFRSDLFFRLSVLRIHMPALRERPEDIPLLARHFVNTLSSEAGDVRKILLPGTIQKLRLLEWPGNVRELYNVIQRAFVAAEGTEIRPEHLLQTQSWSPVEESPVESFKQARAVVLHRFERQYIVDALRRSKGNITQAARLAKKDRRAFGRMVKRHQIDREGLTD